MKSAARRVTAGWVSPRRAVPAAIPRPPYLATGGIPTLHEGAITRTADEIARMRRACRAAARVLRRLESEIAPGVTTDHIDAVAHEAYLAEGGFPSTLGYRGFPKSLCTSVNEVVAHGIPDSRPLEDGDIVNCDVTIYLDGVHGDCSATFPVGAVDDGTLDLVAATEESMRRGIAAVRPGGRVRDIGCAISAYAEQRGYGVVRELAGHGIGTEFHCRPTIPHIDDRTARARLLPGMTFTIEPMLTLGDPAVTMWDDGWTIVTVDGEASAQFEHTVLVTADGVEILTADDETAR